MNSFFLFCYYTFFSAEKSNFISTYHDHRPPEGLRTNLHDSLLIDHLLVQGLKIENLGHDLSGLKTMVFLINLYYFQFQMLYLVIKIDKEFEYDT